MQNHTVITIVLVGLLLASISWTPNLADWIRTGSAGSLLSKAILPPAYSLTNPVSAFPAISITSPIPGTVLNKPTLTVTGTTNAAGGAQITNVTIQLKPGAVHNAIPISSGNWSFWAYTLDMTHYPVGRYKIVATATTAAGVSKLASIQIAYSLYDNFGSAYVLSPSSLSPDKKWYGVWNGGGSFGTHVVSGAGSFYESSQPVTAKLQTNSALAVTTQKFRNFVLSVDVTTNQQLRQNNPPNSWEVAWIIWHWKDDTHFKYFVVKTDGSEIGKYDGGANPGDQRILKTSSSAKVVLGKTMHWQITVKGNHTTVYLDGSKVFDLYNVSTYYSGKVGLYSEDSSVSFSNLNILPTR